MKTIVMTKPCVGGRVIEASAIIQPELRNEGLLLPMRVINELQLEQMISIEEYNFIEGEPVLEQNPAEEVHGVGFFGFAIVCFKGETKYHMRVYVNNDSDEIIIGRGALSQMHEINPAFPLFDALLELAAIFWSPWYPNQESI